MTLSASWLTCPGAWCDADGSVSYAASVDGRAVTAMTASPRPAWLQRGDAAAARRLIRAQIAATPDLVHAPIDVLTITATGAQWSSWDRLSACAGPVNVRELFNGRSRSRSGDPQWPTGTVADREHGRAPTRPERRVGRLARVADGRYHNATLRGSTPHYSALLHVPNHRAFWRISVHRRRFFTSAKPPPPVQIRAAPPLSINKTRTFRNADTGK